MKILLAALILFTISFAASAQTPVLIETGGCPSPTGQWTDVVSGCNPLNPTICNVVDSCFIRDGNPGFLFFTRVSKAAGAIRKQYPTSLTCSTTSFDTSILIDEVDDGKFVLIAFAKTHEDELSFAIWLFGQNGPNHTIRIGVGKEANTWDHVFEVQPGQLFNIKIFYDPANGLARVVVDDVQVANHKGQFDIVLTSEDPQQIDWSGWGSSASDNGPGAGNNVAVFGDNYVVSSCS